MLQGVDTLQALVLRLVRLVVRLTPYGVLALMTRVAATARVRDVVQLGAFVLGSALAGLSGVLYTSWGQFITPSSIGLPAAAMPIVWVAFSGRTDLTATLVGTFILLFGFQTLTVYSQEAALVVARETGRDPSRSPQERCS